MLCTALAARPQACLVSSELVSRESTSSALSSTPVNIGLSLALPDPNTPTPTQQAKQKKNGEPKLRCVCLDDASLSCM